MDIQGKVWGKTSALFEKNNVEIHRIEGKLNGYCSKHKHACKFNMFFVEKGILKIKIWKSYGLVDETVLKQFESTIVKPGEMHQFVVMEDGTVCYEIYWTEIDPTDIQRENVGGVNDNS